MRVAAYSKLRKGRFSCGGQVFHVVSRTWQRQKIFSDWYVATLACRSFCSRQALQNSRLLCWVLMPDHAHWLLQLDEPDDISSLVGRMKSISAREVRVHAGRAGSIWYPGFYERAIRREQDLVDVARYIIANPLRGKLCCRLGHYPFWDAVYL